MKNNQARGRFTTQFGAIMAAAGAAVGLGNIWNFPYMAGNNGGSAFIVIYVLCIGLIGLPIMISEFVLGKRGQRNLVGSLRVLAPKSRWHWAGWLGVASCFFILAFYGVVAGWSFAHVGMALVGVFNGLGAPEIGDRFSAYIAHPYWPIVWHFVFMMVTVAIVVAGVRRGIERFSKIFMPILFVILLVLAVRALTLPDAMSGLAFLFYPDFSQISAVTVLMAIGAAFFSIGVGNGVMVTFGSYLNKDTDITNTAMQVSCMDTCIAIIAGIAIFPAVFALGFEPTNSSGLAFITIPSVFQSLPGGIVAHYFFTLIFFLLLSIAALTSSVATLEAVVAVLTEEFRLNRPVASLGAAIVMFLVGIPCALSFSSDPIVIFGMNFFDLVIFLVEAIFLPVGGLVVVLFVGWHLRSTDVLETLKSGGGVTRYPKIYLALTRFVVPIFIVSVLVRALYDAL